MVRMDSLSSLPPHIQPPMAQVPSAMRALTREVPLIFVNFQHIVLSCIEFGKREPSSQAIAGWRTCHRNGGSFCKAQTGRSARLGRFLRGERQPEKNPWAENCVPRGELAEESGANHNR